MQTAPSVDLGGEHVPNLGTKDEEPNDFVKEYLAAQQNLIRQQVVPEPAIVSAEQPIEAVAAEPEPMEQPAEQAQDLSPKKQTRAARSPRTSESSPTGRRSLRSASGTVAPEEPEVTQALVPESEEPEKMPAAESDTPAAVIVDPVPADIQSPVTVSAPAATPLPEKDQTPEQHKESESQIEPAVTHVPDEPATAEQSLAGENSVRNNSLRDNSIAQVSEAQPEIETAAPAEIDDAAANEDAKGENGPANEPISAVVAPEPKEVAGEAMDTTVESMEATSSQTGGEDGPSEESVSTIVPESKSESGRKQEADGEKGDEKEGGLNAGQKAEETGKERERSVREKADRRRLVVEKKEEVGDETKSKPKRKWGSGSDRQISRGISSTQLNSLLPNKEKVSPGSQEEVQAGDSENITMSGKPFSQPANGSLGVPHRPPADQQEHQNQDHEQSDSNKPVNGQVTAAAEEASQAGDAGPARNPASNVLFVENLTRPFTLPALHALLKTHGNIDTNKFWIDKIKSMCMVAYASVEEAETARKGLHGTRWPPSNPKTLVADFATEDEIESRKKEAEKPVVVAQTTAARTSDKYDITIRKTVVDDKEGSNKAVRDWDRDKVSQSSPPAKRSRRSPSPVQRTHDKQGMS